MLDLENMTGRACRGPAKPPPPAKPQTPALLINDADGRGVLEICVGRVSSTKRRIKSSDSRHVEAPPPYSASTPLHVGPRAARRWMGVGTPPPTSHLVSSAQLILPRPAGIGSAQVLLLQFSSPAAR